MLGWWHFEGCFWVHWDRSVLTAPVLWVGPKLPLNREWDVWGQAGFQALLRVLLLSTGFRVQATVFKLMVLRNRLPCLGRGDKSHIGTVSPVFLLRVCTSTGRPASAGPSTAPTLSEAAALAELYPKVRFFFFSLPSTCFKP